MNTQKWSRIKIKKNKGVQKIYSDKLIKMQFVKCIVEIQNYKTKAELKRMQSAPAARHLASDLRKNKIN